MNKRKVESSNHQIDHPESTDHFDTTGMELETLRLVVSKMELHIECGLSAFEALEKRIADWTKLSLAMTAFCTGLMAYSSNVNISILAGNLLLAPLLGSTVILLIFLVSNLMSKDVSSNGDNFKDWRMNPSNRTYYGSAQEHGVLSYVINGYCVTIDELANDVRGKSTVLRSITSTLICTLFLCILIYFI